MSRVSYELLPSRTTESGSGPGRYGSRQIWTLPSDSVLSLTRTAHARFLSDSTHSRKVFLFTSILTSTICTM